MRKFSLVPIVVSMTALGLFLWMWYYKIQLGMHRYFDIDELAYLYWATHIHMGLRPYIDFLFYPAPGFFALLVPIISAFDGIAVFAASRSAMLVVFGLLAISLMLVFWELRRSWVVVFIPFLLVFLPLPSDKFIEIRPDTLAITLFLFGLWLHMRYMNGKKNALIVAGLLYGTSIAISQKMVVNVGLVVLGLIGWISMEKKSWKTILPIVGGIGIVGGVCLFYLLSLGNFPMVWYSLTTLSFEVSNLGILFPISPRFFFFHNDVIYGTGGYHIGYFLNLFLWSAGLCMGIIRLFTPFCPHGKKGVWQELIVSTVFLFSFIVFCFLLPMKHPQYLIPPAVFVVWYCADGTGDLWERIKHTRIGQMVFLFGWVIVGVLIYQGYMLVTMPKLYWTNDGDVQKAQSLWNTIPQHEPIFDMVGLTMKYPQPYMAPVYPIGQMKLLISYPLPSLQHALEATNTRYIYSGYAGRFATLSAEDQEYIIKKFIPVNDQSLWVKKTNDEQ